MLPFGGLHVKHAVQRGIWVPTQHLLCDQGNPLCSRSGLVRKWLQDGSLLVRILTTVDTLQTVDIIIIN
jgi:hypothetical protein